VIRQQHLPYPSHHSQEAYVRAFNKRKIYPTWPEGKQKVFTMSYDDGNDCDILLVDLMRKHHVKGTFNINSGLCSPAPMPYDAPKKWRRLTMQECLNLYGDNMEIAVHGLIHPTRDRTPTPNAMQDIPDDCRVLERATRKISGTPPTSKWWIICAPIRFCSTISTRRWSTIPPPRTSESASPGVRPVPPFLCPNNSLDQMNTPTGYAGGCQTVKEHQFSLLENWCSLTVCGAYIKLIQFYRNQRCNSKMKPCTSWLFCINCRNAEVSAFQCIKFDFLKSLCCHGGTGGASYD